MIKKINEYFICDSDEKPSATDYIFFYGISTMILMIGVFFLIGLAKGVR